MSPAKPTTPKDTDAEAPKKQRVFPADFEEFVTATAAELGDGWTVDTDSEPHSGVSAFLTHPDGRRVGIKHLWRGAAVQTWAVDVPPREFESSGDAESYADSLKHLTNGIRYNVGVCFTNNPPAATTARNIRTRLLPAFDGKRLPLRAFPKRKRPRRPTTAEKTPASTAPPTDGTAPEAPAADHSASKKPGKPHVKKAPTTVKPTSRARKQKQPTT
ncbi:hypothetical protein [Streptomyces vastus]|uniref:Uncharacterized protein n=1 Tax=Streptomyces vastus TaxID=285451 RepID=A0ABP6DZM4_9ACTN